MRMLIIVPTRGRPDNAARLWQAFIDTDTQADVVFCADNDDPSLADYDSLDIPLWVGPRKRLVGTLNDVSSHFVDDFDIIGFLGDDTLPKEKNWDSQIVDSFRKNMVAYGNDGHQGEGLPTGVFLDSNIIRTLGYMVPPTFIHLFADNYWKTLGEALGTLTYLPDLDIEHLHPYAGKAQHDKTYEEANSGAVWVNDELAFHNYVENQLSLDVEKLNA
ncbi:glycosyltransferase [Streptomyces phage Blueeyedbeauty]|uniref:Glycosyltransferase n=1 Tax=Streptomyces phage Blueeyedbeauty TaxID=2250336 RepID=A0A345L1R8_9CAUD|nr:glycosyltransferase [Streptomyces phage Blueeyedbeauty]AXH49220.1 glycosyltransferase [Streptomyces phage Blueeyedbeauty]